MTSPYFDAIDAAEAAAIEAATGDQVRAALRPYLDALRDVNPGGYAHLTHQLRSKATGSEWIAAFLGPTRFGWAGKRWPAPLNAEIAAVVARLCLLEEAAYLAHQRATESL